MTNYLDNVALQYNWTAPGAVILLWAMVVLIFGVACNKNKNESQLISRLICLSIIPIIIGIMLQISAIYNYSVTVINTSFLASRVDSFLKILCDHLCFSKIRMVIQLAVLVGAFLCLIVFASYYNPNWFWRKLNQSTLDARKIDGKMLNINAASFSFESLFLLCCYVFGLWLLPLANDLLTIYLVLELIALCLYPLIVQRDSLNSKIISLEVGIKYFVLSATMSCVYLLGTMFIYAALGGVDFENIAAAITILPNDSSLVIVVLGLVLVIFGIMFKLSAAPFHFWAPDLYHGTNTLIIMIVSSIGKIGSIGVLFTLLQYTKHILQLHNVIMIVGCVSLIIGGFGGLFQQNIRRLLAYSTIGHIGFIILGFATGDNLGYAAALIYGAIYSLCIAIPLFAGLIIIEALLGIKLQQISDLANLAKRNSTLSLFFTVIVLSIAGIPPFIGFFAKFYVLKSLIINKFYFATGIAVIMSVVSCAYYLKIIKVIYYNENNDLFKEDDIIQYDLRPKSLVSLVLIWGLGTTSIYVIYANDIYNYIVELLV